MTGQIDMKQNRENTINISTKCKMSNATICVEQNDKDAEKDINKVWVLVSEEGSRKDRKNIDVNGTDKSKRNKKDKGKKIMYCSRKIMIKN